ncbi:type II secretion system F family protein [Embleya sp. NPDC050154]|uniref:type II secretion system F family protein n=1 Tax=unclassified Embleya TaxID=2699296 RepID=UPI0037B3401E
MISTWYLIPGALVGAGIALLIRELRPAPPDLTAAAERLTGRPTAAALAARDTGTGSAFGDALARLAQRVPGVSVPHTRLALVGQSAGDHLRTKAAMGLLGLLLPVLFSTAVSMLGITLPFVVPVGACLVLCVVMWQTPDRELAVKAKAARVEFQHAAATYLDLVALQRAGDAGPAEALEHAAQVGNGWAFLRIQDALARARAHGADPWQALRDLAGDLDLPELADVADIIELAGVEGAAVYGTLRARAAALRTELLSAEHERANTDSERLVVPGTVLVILLTIFLGLPAILQIVAI